MFVSRLRQQTCPHNITPFLSFDLVIFISIQIPPRQLRQLGKKENYFCLAMKLPQTEALKQSIQQLNATPSALRDEYTTAAFVSASPNDTAEVKTLRFLIHQLVFYAVNDVAKAQELLACEVATPFSPPQTLHPEWVELVASRWMEHGKGMVQAMRDAAVASYCGQQRSDDTAGCSNYIHVQAMVRTCTGHVGEVADGESLKVDYHVQHSEHFPTALVSFPATTQHTERTLANLDMNSIYALFSAVDAIQQRIDHITGATATA